ncbi:MAG: hypothetical protein HY719_09990 [Planctomycetes bacterium]|nr:hypothetical protein [Planctomycetota bacterium]
MDGRISGLHGRIDALSSQIEQARTLTARGLIFQLRRAGVLPSIQDAEFQVFSQFGDDGIIQYLVHRLQVPAARRRFVEFGVETYRESNTRFLLQNDNWAGLVMDGGEENVAAVRAAEFFWRHDLTARAAFITRDNINHLIASAGFGGPIGLLSIDIDGNDYWVWERLTVCDPIIIITEYNSVFGPDRAVTIPYDPDFRRHQAHHSGLYWGASLKAMAMLAAAKGYAFVGSNSAGNNAFFVKREMIGPLSALTAREGYVCSRYRESRDEAGRLTFASGPQRLALIRHLPVWDLEAQRTVPLADLESAGS